MPLRISIRVVKPDSYKAFNVLLGRRIFLVVVVLSVFGGSLVSSVLYDSYKQSILNQSTKDQENDAHILARLLAEQVNTKQTIINEAFRTLSIVTPSDSLVIVEDANGNTHKVGAIEGIQYDDIKHDISESLLLKEGQRNIAIDKNVLIWNSVNVPDSDYRLIYVQRYNNDTLNSFVHDYGVPVLITFLVVGWIIVWVAIVLNSLFKKLNDQNRLLEAQSQKISEARDKALNANKAKTAFLANMSHEIRTPLTAILGFSESLLQSDQTMHERISAINTINNSGKHLLQIINEILDLSKIESEKLDVELIPVSPVKLLLETCPLMRMQAEGKGLEFEVNYQFPIPETIRTDPTRLKQILLNLVSNAVKFTEHGYIHLNVSCVEENRQFIIEVVDSGIGMTDEQQEKVFTAFTQADTSTTRKYGGTGLGLTLSKQFAAMLGGSLNIESHAGYGSKMRVVIDTGSLKEVRYYDKPDQLPEEIKPQPAPAYKRNLEGEVLLAEDNPANQKLIKLYLRNVGAKTTIVENGQEAVNLAVSKKFDLILMDMQMPVMNGVDAVKELRKMEYTGPIIALTANTTIEDRDACINAGCNDFLSKPVDRSKFLNILSEYMREAESDDATLSPIVSNLLEDEPEMVDLVVEFINQLPEMIEKINNATANHDRDALKAEVHKLKGVGDGYGYPELTKIAGKIEFQIAADNQQEIDSLINMLGTYTRRIIAAKPDVKEIDGQNTTSVS